jgi:LCP family protein required for cell wall assembly
VDDERPPSPGWSLLKRVLLGGFLIAALSGGATATGALNTASGLAHEIFEHSVTAPVGVVTPEYSGGPETFLVLGSDRRVGSKDAADRSDPPHSDTILLIRFDPEQDQTSVLSIPRDLEVNIRLPGGGIAAGEKVNAAYTLGNKYGGAREGIVLAAETIEREVFPGLKLNGIIDVSFAGFIRVVDTLGCAYVNVDHRYYNQNVGSQETDYTSINLQPGYQKLCYENALDYVRYRHTDSDLVRVARQQDFIRDLREQISPSNVIGQIGEVAKAVGRAITSTIDGSASDLIELAKLITFSQGKPLRQVKFRFVSENAVGPGGGSYVTSTPDLERATLEDFLHGHEQLALPPTKHSSHHTAHSHHSVSGTGSLRALGLYPTSSTGEGEAVKASFNVPFKVLYPTVQTAQAAQQTVRAYTLDDQQRDLHHAYVEVWQQNVIGGYYDLEGTDWLNPPLFAHAHRETIAGRSYLLVDDGSHIHVIGWREGRVLYWVTNTLLEELSNAQMVAIAKSAQPLH